jgi:zinc transport system ATP-binding protein
VGEGLLGLKSPASGTIAFGDGSSAREIGYLPQQKDSETGLPASVMEVVLSGTLNALPAPVLHQKTARASRWSSSAAVGMEDLKNACFRELSGGQQQRAR